MRRKSLILGLVAILSLPALAADNVHLSIDASKSGPKIDRNIFGQFAENLGHGLYEGIWVGPDSSIPNTRGIRNDVVAALRDLKVPNVRWPGGCFADQYHWRKGIGPRDKRPAMVNSAWGDVIDTNAFGTDEFMDFMQQIGSTLYVSINIGSGTPQEAAEWLEYMTAAAPTALANERAANRHPDPYQVGFLGIGNESWDCGGAMTADYYVSLMKVYSRFVLNMNPSQRDKNQMLKIAVGPGTPDTEWTEAVMKTWKKHTWAWDISGVSLHWYTVPNGWPPSTASQKFRLDDYVKTLKSTLFMDEFLRKQEAVMDKYDPEKKVTLAVDEWGAWHAPLPGSNPAFLVQQNSIRDAVLASVRAKYEHYQEYLKRIPALRGKPVPIAIDEWAYFGGDRDSYKVVPAYAWAFHEMFRHSNVFQMGAFTFATAMMSENRTEAILNPTGMLFKMYRDHFGTIPVEVKGNSPQPKPTFPAGGDQPAVNPGSDTYPLDVNAALSEDRKTLAIAVLNPSDSEQSIRIAINGAKLASAGKLWRMAPDSIDATVQIDKKPEVQLEEQSLGAFPENITLRPFSVNIYSYQVQLSRSFERGSNETNETVLCLRNRHAHCAGIATHRPGAN